MKSVNRVNEVNQENQLITVNGDYTVNNNAVNILCIHTQVLLCVKVNKLYSSTSSANINNNNETALRLVIR